MIINIETVTPPAESNREPILASGTVDDDRRFYVWLDPYADVVRAEVVWLPSGTPAPYFRDSEMEQVIDAILDARAALRAEPTEAEAEGKPDPTWLLIRPGQAVNASPWTDPNAPFNDPEQFDPEETMAFTRPTERPTDTRPNPIIEPTPEPPRPPDEIDRVQDDIQDYLTGEHEAVPDRSGWMEEPAPEPAPFVESPPLVPTDVPTLLPPLEPTIDMAASSDGPVSPRLLKEAALMRALEKIDTRRRLAELLTTKELDTMLSVLGVGD